MKSGSILNFAAVIRACSAARVYARRYLRITDEMIAAYIHLHEMGEAHSVEAQYRNGELAGGLYGVSWGGYFAGESMFHHATGALQGGVSGPGGAVAGAGMPLDRCPDDDPAIREFWGAQKLPARSSWCYSLKFWPLGLRCFRLKSKRFSAPLKMAVSNSMKWV